MYVYFVYYSAPDDEILDLTKLKESADEKLDVDKTVWYVIWKDLKKGKLLEKNKILVTAFSSFQPFLFFRVDFTS